MLQRARIIAALLPVPIWALAGALALAATAAMVADRVSPDIPERSWKVCFGPRQNCGAQIIDEISSAHSSVRVQAFEFNAEDIAQALAADRRRGVDVEVILDASHLADDQSATGILRAGGVKILADAAHGQHGYGIEHDKVIIVDSGVVITGSANLTHAAERKNGENILTLRDRELASAYERNWQEHAAHSQPLTGP